jgi:hypothetical protein
MARTRQPRSIGGWQSSLPVRPCVDIAVPATNYHTGKPYEPHCRLSHLVCTVLFASLPTMLDTRAVPT